MYKVAIVGASVIYTENEERDIRQFCAQEIKNFPIETTKIISGGADGVDSIAIEVAIGLGYKYQVFPPKTDDWDGYKPRNLKIARQCNELICIAIPYHHVMCYHHEKPEDHEKSAGCWTLNKARELNKPVKLIVTPKR